MMNAQGYPLQHCNSKMTMNKGLVFNVLKWNDIQDLLLNGI